MKLSLKILLLNLSLLTATACTQTAGSEKLITKQFNKIENLIIDHMFETAGLTDSQIDEAEKLMLNQVAEVEKQTASNQITITKSENKIIASFSYPTGNNKFFIVYRKLLGKTAEDWYVVQEFYQSSNKKHSDPFMIKNKDNLIEKIPEIEEGTLTRWAENGKNGMWKKKMVRMVREVNSPFYIGMDKNRWRQTINMERRTD